MKITAPRISKLGTLLCAVAAASVIAACSRGGAASSNASGTGQSGTPSDTSHPLTVRGLGQADYYRLLSVSSGKCVGVTETVSNANLNSGETNQTNVAVPEGQTRGNNQTLVQFACNTTAANQQFYVRPFGGGYQLIARHSGRCVAVERNPDYTPMTNDGAPIVQYDCNGDPDQVWELRQVDSAYRLVEKFTGLCARVTDASAADGAALVLADCSDTGATFYLESLDAALTSQTGLQNRTYRLITAAADQCAHVEGASTDDGAPVIEEPCDGTGRDEWALKISGAGYEAVARQSGKCLDIQNASTDDGAPAVQAACNGGESQRWMLQPIGKAYQLMSRHSGECLGVADTANGAVAAQARCDGSDAQRWFLRAVDAPAAQVGAWGGTITFPTIPVAAALLPNGQVLAWSSWDRYDFVNGNGEREKTFAVTYDPAQHAITDARVVPDHDMFCPGVAMLADGRVHVAGGGSVVRTTSLFDFRTGAWSRDADMSQPRWYNASVALADGGVFTIGGNLFSGDDGIGEVWHPNLGWSVVPNDVLAPVQTGVPENHAEEYVRMHVAPDGRLFVSGPTPNMQWYSPAAPGAITSAGTRGDDEVSQYGVYAMYGIGKILKAGGNVNVDSALDSRNSPSNGNAYLIDINGAAARVERVASMHFARTFANGVVLPDGKVLVVGGAGNGLTFSDALAVPIPEMFDSLAKTWTELAPLPTPRTYHSVALLLPDGRVFVGGGGLCGTCNVNHPDAEIYSPPYLFQGARPVIEAVSGEVTEDGHTFSRWSYGAAAEAATDRPVARFTLVRLSSVTHSTNADQRLVEISFAAETNGGAGTYRLTTPANANIAPPGYYMLFALDGKGVPSTAKIVQLVPTAGP